MSKYLKSSLAALCLAGVTATASATPILPGGETSLQTILNNLHLPGGTAPNVNTDQSGDELWVFEASGTAAATFIIEIAGNAANNVFGIYNPWTSALIPLFSGSASNADRAVVQLYVDGSVDVSFKDFGVPGQTVVGYGAGTLGSQFGFYLSTGVGGSTFYSQQSRNAGNADQMVAFRGDGDTIQLPGAGAAPWGSSSYILAWEDLAYGSGDKDFNDLVLYIESVKPVPEPTTLALLGMGLVGVGLARRRKLT